MKILFSARCVSLGTVEWAWQHTDLECLVTKPFSEPNAHIPIDVTFVYELLN